MREHETVTKDFAAISNHFNKAKTIVETTETSPDPVTKGQKWWCSDEKSNLKVPLEIKLLQRM